MASRDPDVPRLPRGRGLTLNSQAVFRIVMVAVVLVALIVMQRPCADAVSGFVTQFDPDARPATKAPDAGAPAVDPCAGGDCVKLDTSGSPEAIQKQLDRVRDAGNSATP